MKKKLQILFIFIVVASIVMPLLGAEGKAWIPHYYGYYVSSPSDVWQTFHYISNITDNSLTVTITLYDKNGNVIQDDGSATTGIIKAVNTTNYDDNVTGATATFDLAANGTGYVYIAVNAGTSQYGYGIIEWSQSSTNKKKYDALIAHSRVYRLKYDTSTTPHESSYAIQINNGLPF